MPHRLASFHLVPFVLVAFHLGLGLFVVAIVVLVRLLFVVVLGLPPFYIILYCQK